ncbi:MAG: YbaK/EbsC family protein [Candidatus Hodarchaeales archaeon]|jgi:prolyl-tRNA editing enzyme YbaK/EbsC (Cys-tRNA(Pro) deacylase)
MHFEDNKQVDFINKAKNIAKLLDFKCKFIEHKEINGSRSENAMIALNVEIHQIIKCLLLKSRKKTVVCVIIPGDKKLMMKKLETLTGEKKFSLLNKQKVFLLTNFYPGGIPPFIGIHLNMLTFIDKTVLLNDYVYGSGGNPYVGLKFNPRNLIEKGVKVVDIVEE